MDHDAILVHWYNPMTIVPAQRFRCRGGSFMGVFWNSTWNRGVRWQAGDDGWLRYQIHQA